MADEGEGSELAHRLAELGTLELMVDGTTSAPAELSEMSTAIAEARTVAKSRTLTALERYYLGCVLKQAAWESGPEAEADLKRQAFVEFRAAFFDAGSEGVPDALPEGHSWSFPALDRVMIADALLEIIAGPQPVEGENRLADHVAVFLWNIDDRYRPSMLRYAGRSLFAGDAKSAAGMAFDLIRRSVGEDEWNAEPMPATLILAEEALKRLARDARKEGNEDLSDQYKSARAALKETGDWQEVGSRPLISELASRCPQA